MGVDMNKTSQEHKNKLSNARNSRYWKTRGGKIMLTYNNMKRRVDGYVKAHLYEGLDIMGRADFYKFAYESEEFERLYNVWVDSNFENKLSPSIDRIDSDKGYLIENIRWITQSENSRLGAISRHSKS